MNPPVPASGRPLLLTRDEQLTDELHRLAAAAGVSLEVVESPQDARVPWPSAPVVLVGPDALDDLAATRPPRRARVYVVAAGAAPDTVFRAALDVGAEGVLELPEAGPWVVETLGDTVEEPGALATVVAVVGGSGGAGATTFAAALAAVAAGPPARRAGSLAGGSDVRPVVLVDADPLGPGAAQVAGLDDLAGACWGRLLESAGRLGSRSLLGALPQRDGLAVLGWSTGPRRELDPDVVREVVSAARRGASLVVVDLPRCPDPAVTELLHRSDHLVVLTGLTSLAVASTMQVAGRLRGMVPSVHLVARGPVAALDPEEVAGVLDLPLLATVSDERRVREAAELGLGPLRSRRGSLARAAREALAHLDGLREVVA